MFRREHLTKAHAFFEHHGPRALVLARFVPVVRTFTPILAGVGHMRYRTFVVFNVMGAAAWAALATTIGYALGSTVLGIDKYLTPALLVIGVVSLLPGLNEIRRSRASDLDEATSAEKDDEDASGRLSG
jgi:membrane-associated protein